MRTEVKALRQALQGFVACQAGRWVAHGMGLGKLTSIAGATGLSAKNPAQLCRESACKIWSLLHQR